MTDFTSLLLPDRGQPATLIRLVRADGFDAWLTTQPGAVRTLVSAARFTAKPGTIVIVPADVPEQWWVAAGAGKQDDPFALAAVATALPGGTYRFEEDAPIGPAALGWLLAHHRFDRYRSDAEPIPHRVLLSRDPARIDATVAQAEAIALVRDLVDTPAGDLGPTELAAIATEEGTAFGADVVITQGDALRQGYPMIHAVGRAAGVDRAPRLIELKWGDPGHPRVAIIGKGVVFDSGGLNIKHGAGMALMKKDMGGAAHALALARLIMGARLPVRLHLLIPAVENAIAGDAFRPGDVLASRAGTSVEIGNTDAEGRLVLADAITRAAEDDPELILDFATLTGAARVALGPDLPALFANDDGLADGLLSAGRAVADPVWRMPLWAPYTEMLKSTVADINNAGEGGLAGAVTAALFLERFVPPAIPWAHFDTFAWRPSAKPGRPKGGDALGLRTAWSYLQARYGNTASGAAAPSQDR